MGGGTPKDSKEERKAIAPGGSSDLQGEGALAVVCPSPKEHSITVIVRIAVVG